jgi:hypothetical protein
MNNNKFKAVISGLALILGSVFSGAAASASFQPCSGTYTNGNSYNIADNVSPTINCTMLLPLGDAVNDSVDPPSSSYTVNTAAFFGQSDWLFNGKYEINDQGIGTDGSSFFNFSGGNQSGTFTKAGTWSYSDVMFLFKDGGGTNLVGYLINTAVTIGGTYSSPFELTAFPDANGSGSKGVSHISVYYRDTKPGGGGSGGPGSVPEPSQLALLAAGLLGMGASRLRKTKV